jgi:GT2 family glycosyltransferase
MSQTEKLDYGLVIPTYKREAILPRCLRLAAEQTVAPKEIIVVDASPDWEKTRHQIMQELAAKYPAIDWKYVQTKRASSAAQRNQGIDLATADILFLIDDDSLMYPDCAEEIMRIYTRDVDKKVLGIMSFLAPIPPSSDSESEKPIDDNKMDKTLVSWFREKKWPLLRFKLIKMINPLIKNCSLLPPYDHPPIRHEFKIPDDIRAHRVPDLPGCAMTFRRQVFEKIQFEETLERYAVSEDIDVSYRVARLGVLLCALNARICHMKAEGGRLSRFAVAVLIQFNMIVLHRFHNTHFDEFKNNLRPLLLKRMMQLTLKDLLAGSWSFPSTRGMFFVLLNYKRLLSKSIEELKSWYPQFQQELINSSISLFRKI